MKLVIAIIALLALSHAGTPATQPPAYQTPSCHGIANVPGYEKCHD